MRILMLSNLFPPYYLGGYELTCDMASRALVAQGHDVDILTSTHGTEKDRCTNEPHVHRQLKLYIPFDKPPKLQRQRRWQVEKDNYAITQKIISKIQPDVIFVWSLLRITLGPAQAAQDSGVPVAYTFNDEYMAGFTPSRFEWKPRALARYVLDNWIFPHTSFYDLNFENTTCISQLLKTSLIKKDLPINNSRVIYHGIVFNNFPPKPNIGHIGSPTHVLYMGQLQPYKGVHTLIKAAHLASKENTPFKVSIVGDGPQAYKRELHSLAKQGRAQIEFVGKVDYADVPAIYRAHDFLVFPSTWQEPFGLTHLEAMASGIPVISTADGGQGEFLQNGENSLVFEKENVPQLAACMQRLVHEKDLSYELAQQARKTVQNKFTVQRYVAELEAFLQATIQKTTQKPSYYIKEETAHTKSKSATVESKQAEVYQPVSAYRTLT